MTILEPEHKSIVPKDPFEVFKKTDLLKPFKKGDASNFSGYYYEGKDKKDE